MNNKTKLTIAVASIIAAFSLAFVTYHAFVLVPLERIDTQERQAREARAHEDEVRIEKEIKLEECRVTAYTAYSNNWDGHCELIGKDKDCSLPTEIADKFEQGLNTMTDRCVTLYK